MMDSGKFCGGFDAGGYRLFGSSCVCASACVCKREHLWGKTGLTAGH
jgi:hypothetical protein